MISTGIVREGFPVYGPMVYLAPDKHAFLVLGDGPNPLITWSMSWQSASEQADIHDAVVVAVPIVRDSSWLGAHPDDVPPASVPVRAASMPRRDAASDEAPGRPRDAAAQAGVIAGAVAGYAIGRAARGRERGSAAGWSSARPDVVGQDQSCTDCGVPHSSTEPHASGLSVERARPFGDAAAPELPADPEKALRDAFSGDDEAVAAFHAAASARADVATLERVRDGLVREDTPE